MEIKTKKALIKSIGHWRRLARGRTPGFWSTILWLIARAFGCSAERGPLEGISSADCALCKRFNLPNMDAEKRCVGCPVFKRSGHKNCQGTPYDGIGSIVRELGFDSKLFKKAAQREVEFLESLLPKEQTDE